MTPSPCTGLCQIDPATGWCKGCARTINEITRWATTNDADRAAIAAALASRRMLATRR